MIIYYLIFNHPYIGGDVMATEKNVRNSLPLINIELTCRKVNRCHRVDFNYLLCYWGSEFSCGLYCPSKLLGEGAGAETKRMAMYFFMAFL